MRTPGTGIIRGLILVAPFWFGVGACATEAWKEAKAQAAYDKLSACEKWALDIERVSKHCHKPYEPIICPGQSVTFGPEGK